jgi:hypothetical protein
MSALIFDRKLHRIGLVRRHQERPLLVAIWPAHNDVAKKAVGIWPSGMYKWAYYKPHKEEGLLPGAVRQAYGGLGIHVFSVAGRPGIGVHAGRTLGQPEALGGITTGCIRVTPAAMQSINTCHRVDRLSGIWVADDLSLLAEGITV